jgi:hypothetical protein
MSTGRWQREAPGRRPANLFLELIDRMCCECKYGPPKHDEAGKCTARRFPLGEIELHFVRLDMPPQTRRPKQLPRAGSDHVEYSSSLSTECWRYSLKVSRSSAVPTTRIPTFLRRCRGQTSKHGSRIAAGYTQLQAVDSHACEQSSLQCIHDRQLAEPQRWMLPLAILPNTNRTPGHAIDLRGETYSPGSQV